MVKARYPAAIAFTIALSVGMAVSFISEHEGTGPTETIMVSATPSDVLLQTAATTIKAVQSVRYVAYADPGHGWKVPTICYGHTRGVQRGMRATQEQCDQWLRDDIEKICTPAMAYITTKITPSQASAVCSFTYNVGRYAFRDSTLLMKLNEGDFQGAADQFPRWNKSAGKVLPGLVRRRADERKLFMEGI